MGPKWEISRNGDPELAGNGGARLLKAFLGPKADIVGPKTSKHVDLPAKCAEIITY